MLPVAVAWSSYDSIVMLCTSGFVDDVMFSYHGASWPESSTMLILEVRQVVVPVGCQQTTVFGWVHQNEAPGGAKSAVCEWLFIP